MQRVKVSEEQCARISSVVKGIKFRPPYVERELISIKVDDETKMRTFFFVVAICEQTHILRSEKRNLVGWNYLEKVFSDLARDNPSFVDPTRIAKLTTEELSNELRPLFSDSTPDKCTLDRLEQRTRHMIDSSKLLCEKYGCKLSELVAKADNSVQDLYSMLEEFEVYSDPLRKKSTLFVKLISSAGMFTINDPDNLIPVMDYHIQRVLLRTGCVEVLDPELKAVLFAHSQLDSDEPVRSACVEAMRVIQRDSGIGIWELDDFFWSLGRSCCMLKMLCSDHECNKDPCTFSLVVDVGTHDNCVFEGVCKGIENEEYKQYWQPVVDTHYY